jgi:hypothetical protein
MVTGQLTRNDQVIVLQEALDRNAGCLIMFQTVGHNSV